LALAVALSFLIGQFNKFKTVKLMYFAAVMFVTRAILLVFSRASRFQKIHCAMVSSATAQVAAS